MLIDDARFQQLREASFEDKPLVTLRWAPVKETDEATQCSELVKVDGLRAGLRVDVKRSQHQPAEPTAGPPGPSLHTDDPLAQRHDPVDVLMLSVTELT